MANASEAFAIALSHHQAGRLAEAEQIYRQILAVEPRHADSWHLLGLIGSQTGNDDVAVRCISRAIELNAAEPAYWVNLGNALKTQGRLSDSADAYRQGLRLKPDLVEAYNNLGTLFQSEGKLTEAADAYRRGLAINQNHAELHANLGTALDAMGQLDEAVACYRQALQINPGNAVANYNLGNTLQAQGKIGEAVASFQRAVELRPLHAKGHSNLATALKMLGRIDEAIVGYRRALDLKPKLAELQSNLLFALHCRPGICLSELAAAHAEFESTLARPLRSTWKPHKNERIPDRPLRIGLVSPDFGQHPVGHFVIRALEYSDHRECETVCYSDRPQSDEWTSRFQAAASKWRDCKGLHDEALAEQIREDRIDILFDLAGHTANNRLLTFARKPAPIQVTWAGYPGTTGLAAMDYILADRFHVPADAERYYSERVLRMPNGYVCYDPPAYAPAVSHLPALDRGFVTFGSFNSRAKLNVGVIELWAWIMNRVLHSRVVLKYKGMDDPAVVGWLTSEFARRGIAAERIDCRGWSPHRELLAAYGQVDLALDPFPYSGGLTTCEALWMGVPVVTCPGETFASRHSLSHLSNATLTETIAANSDEYANIAVSLASDPPRLATLRSSLRERTAASPLCDGRTFAEHFVKKLREIWRTWCLGE